MGARAGASSTHSKRSRNSAATLLLGVHRTSFCVRFGRGLSNQSRMTHRTYEIVRGIVLLAIASSAIGWCMWRCLKRSDDPARLIFKWILTVPVVCGLLFWVGGPFATSSEAGAFIGVPLMAVGGIVLTAIWRHNIASMIAKPFSDLYDGGSQEPIPHPAYSVGQSKQKQGKLRGGGG